MRRKCFAPDATPLKEYLGKFNRGGDAIPRSDKHKIRNRKCVFDTVIVNQFFAKINHHLLIGVTPTKSNSSVCKPAID